MNQNFYNFNSSSFDQFQPLQYPLVHQPPQETSTKILQARENIIEAIQVFLKKYDQIPSEEKCIALLRAEEKFFKVKQALEEEQNPPEIIQELLLKLIHDLQLLNKIQPKQAEEKGINKQAQKKEEEKSIVELLAEEQADRINSLFQDHNPLQFFISLDGDDEDDNYEKESIISTNMDIFETSSSDAITTSPSVLPIEDPEVSLIMENEELNTILEKESDEFIKSSVEDLVPIPSKFKDTSGSDSTFVDDESLSDKDVPEDNVKFYLNPLFEFDDEYISSDVNPLFDEVLEDIECKDSYDPNLDESTFLVTPLFDSNEDEYFIPDDDVELLHHHDPSIPKTSVASLLEGFTVEPPLEENDNLFDLESENDEWKKILYDAQIDDLMYEDKVFDLGIHDQKFSPIYDYPDYEDSRARSFVHHSIFNPSHAYIWESDILDPIDLPFNLLA
nr:hypothetical protein [Tanacetum cinerariifolium]